MPCIFRVYGGSPAQSLALVEALAVPQGQWLKIRACQLTSSLHLKVQKRKREKKNKKKKKEGYLLTRKEIKKTT
jgi:hypothetical protein